MVLGDLSHQYECHRVCRTWGYQLLECKGCGLGFAHPKPTWRLLQTFYSENYGSYDGTKTNPEQEARSVKVQIAKLRMAKDKSRILAVAKTTLGRLAELLTGKTVTHSLGIPLQLPLDAHIFDLGFGSGNWLLTMSQLGYHQLYGYDIEGNSANATRLERNGINVSSGEFLDNDYPESTFDCIRLEHVFEHLLEPLDVLKKCYAMLKPGGYLVLGFPCKGFLEHAPVTNTFPSTSTS